MRQNIIKSTILSTNKQNKAEIQDHFDQKVKSKPVLHDAIRQAFEELEIKDKTFERIKDIKSP